MSTYAARRRPPQKKTSIFAILLMLVSLIVLPVLGFAAWKVFKAPPKVKKEIVYELADGTRTTTPPPTQQAPNPENNSLAKELGSFDRSGEEGAMASGNQTADNQALASNTGSKQSGPMGTGNRAGKGGNKPRSSTFSGGGSGFGGGMGRSAHVGQATDRFGAVLQDALNIPRKVLVVWLFDQSASAQSLRNEVIGELPRMYDKFGLTAVAADAAAEEDAQKKLDAAPALSLVGEFGNEFKMLTEQPVADLAELQAATAKISASSSPVENTFAAIKAAAEKIVDYRKKKGRFVTIVVVTDESGNDRTTIDEVLAKLTPYGIPVQVIGPSAQFGRTEGPNIAAEGAAKPGEVLVSEGPDSHDPDAILLEGQGMGRDQPIETGLAPYHLARLCKETGGQFFSTTGAADPALKGYEPEYMSEADYAKQLAGNKAKTALVAAAQLPRAAVTNGFTTSFSNDDEVKRNRALQEAQKHVVKVMPGIDALLDALKRGEADVPKLAGTNDRRWRAAFELALGRAGAAKVRHQGYNDMTAQMKAGRKFEKAGSQFWVLEPTDEPMGVSVNDKLAQKSRDYLKHVASEYPGSPWARAAEEELKHPMSWKWVEH